MSLRRLKTRRFEQLETRFALAGNVAVSSSNGNLSLFGDSLSNNFSILKGNVAGEYRIVGANDASTNQATTINGSNEITVTGVTGTVSIQLGSGNDQLLVRGLKCTDLAIDGGNGNDTINIGNRVSVLATNPSDNVQIISNSLVIDAGGGKDTVNLNRIYGNGTTRADVTVTDLVGNLTLNSYVVFADEFKVYSSNSADSISIGYTTARVFNFETNNGDDLLSFYTSHLTAGGTLKALGGANGNHYFAFDVNNFEGDITITPGEGIGTILFSRSVARRVTMYGGANDDTYLLGRYYKTVNGEAVLTDGGNTIERLAIYPQFGNDNLELATNAIDVFITHMHDGNDTLTMRSNSFGSANVWGDEAGGVIYGPYYSGYDIVYNIGNSYSVFHGEHGFLESQLEEIHDG